MSSREMWRQTDDSLQVFVTETKLGAVLGSAMDITEKPLCIFQSNGVTVKVFNSIGESSLLTLNFPEFSWAMLIFCSAKCIAKKRSVRDTEEKGKTHSVQFTYMFGFSRDHFLFLHNFTR